MKTPEDYYTLARAMFISTYPDYQQALADLTPEDASQYGMTLDSFRTRQADRLYAAWLREKKQDAILFSIQLAEPDKSVAIQVIEAYLKSHATALGMSWEEFCVKHAL